MARAVQIKGQVMIPRIWKMKTFKVQNGKQSASSNLEIHAESGGKLFQTIDLVPRIFMYST